jgi:hypothetical protein
VSLADALAVLVEEGHEARAGPPRAGAASCFDGLWLLPDPAETTILVTMVLTVAGSVILHGFGAPAAARAFASRESPPAPN